MIIYNVGSVTNMKKPKNSKVPIKANKARTHQSYFVSRQARALRDFLKYIGRTVLIYQSFSIIQNVDSAATCSPSVTKYMFHNWLYNAIMPKIFDGRGWLCRITGWDCFDEMIRTNATLTNIMNEWWTNKKEGNFLPWLKDFNPSAFEYFCLNSNEEFRFNVLNYCSSVLRSFNSSFATNNCPNKNLIINDPFFLKQETLTGKEV